MKIGMEESGIIDKKWGWIIPSPFVIMKPQETPVKSNSISKMKSQSYFELITFQSQADVETFLSYDGDAVYEEFSYPTEGKVMKYDSIFIQENEGEDTEEDFILSETTTTEPFFVVHWGYANIYEGEERYEVEVSYINNTQWGQVIKGEVVYYDIN